jgi:hypothetical protein
MRSKKTFGQKIHSLMFAEAGKVHDGLQSELAENIREDIIHFKVSDKPSISSLTVAQKIKLINTYRAILGNTKRVKLPSNYNPKKRGAQDNPNAMPTPDQMAELHRRLDKLGFSKTGDARARFIERQCGSRTPATRAKLQKVMGAARSMEERGWRANGASEVK